jgi:signal transduction histidine kinase
MILDFKDFGEKLNSIGDGLQNAVNEKVKSERFKTELITNVSHDIKTPLTSIINYVDLLKKEEIKNETAKEYIEVIDRHSERLKKLVEDLVEASKASTGNMTVDFADCNVGVLITQALGEFDERFRKSHISPVLKKSQSDVIIKADARLLWRVFDNLLSNICKYSLPDTRAYLETYVSGNKAFIEFKNISKCEINLDSDELTERFVRGDSSRNTDGSGLGLSIAKSLTELQNGQMDITVDGDLFKVVLQFDV